MHLGEELQVVLDAEIWIETERLRDIAEVGFDRPRLGGDVVAQDSGRGRVKLQEPYQNAEQGGLPGAIWPNHAEDAGTRDSQVDAVERYGRAEALAEVGESNDWWWHRDTDLTRIMGAFVH